MSPRGKSKQRLSRVHQRRGLRRGHGGGCRLKWQGLFALVAVCASLAALAAWFALSRGSDDQSGPPKAAIVDQLGLTFPNPAFVQDATSLLEGVGYAVDYYPGEQVTVQFYRNLPAQHYALVILRVHSAVIESGRVVSHPPSQGRSVTKALKDLVFLFTSEPYSETKYVEEQAKLRLFPVCTTQADFCPEGAAMYYGIAPEFVRASMRGDFDGATIVLMGCNGLSFDHTASVFAQRGAKTFIGWNGPISVEDTDPATLRLLHHLVVEKRTPSEAVAQTMTEVGPDPSYGSKLVLYPAEAGASAAE